MKKIGLASLAIIIAAGAYYFSTGSEQLASAMKTQVNAEFATLQTKGFDVKAKEVSKQEEHFVLSFDEPAKIAAYLTSKGAKISAADAEMLKGLELGIDVKYLANAYSSVSLDLYPMTLPTVLTDSVEDASDKELLEQVKKMLAKKVFLVHVDVNKLGTGFKGYVTDIDESLQAKDQSKEPLNIILKDMTFKGSIEDEKLGRMTQVLKKFSILIANEMTVELTDITSEYQVSGKSAYDYDSNYKIDKIKALIPGELDFNMEGIEIASSAAVEQGLANVNVKTNIKSMHMKDKTQDTSLDSLQLKMEMNNLAVSAIEKLENVDPDDEAAIQALLKELLSHGVEFKVDDLSLKTFKLQDKEMKGFTLSAAIDIDKSLDLNQVATNPMLALAAIDADLKLSLSDDLFALAAQQPQAVMVMMLIQPESVNQQKVYKVELKKGKLTVNGKPMM
ncbi:MAG: DUF945 family protein [Sulfurovum sp.]|nr:DUF945 family protein [Sulfurovum sp.]